METLETYSLFLELEFCINMENAGCKLARYVEKGYTIMYAHMMLNSEEFQKSIDDNLFTEIVLLKWTFFLSFFLISF